MIAPIIVYWYYDSDKANVNDHPIHTHRLVKFFSNASNPT